MYKILALLLLFCSNVLAQQANDIRVVQTYPNEGNRTPLGIPMGVRAIFQNVGTMDQISVPLIATIIYEDSIVYEDTVIENNWASFDYVDANFKDFTLTQKGDYTVCFTAVLSNDEKPFDNKLCISTGVRYEADIKCVSVIYPPKDTTLPKRSAVRVRGLYTNVGVRNIYDLKVRLQIKRCSDGKLCFTVDSTLADLNRNTFVEFIFPTTRDTSDIRNLEPGCYKVAVIALLSDDVDRTNDTAVSTFTIDQFESVEVEPSDESLTLYNYPNPFSAKTNIGFDLPSDGVLTLKLLDAMGRCIITLVSGERMSAGSHEVELLAEHLETGLYLCQMTFTGQGEASYRAIKKLTLVK
jgi:hypothetical protein